MPVSNFYFHFPDHFKINGLGLGHELLSASIAVCIVVWKSMESLIFNINIVIGTNELIKSGLSEIVDIENCLCTKIKGSCLRIVRLQKMSQGV